MSEQISDFKRPVVIPELLKYANSPLAQSLLYDLDLLPEQLAAQKEVTIGLIGAYNRLIGVLIGIAAMEQDKAVATSKERA